MWKKQYRSQCDVYRNTNLIHPFELVDNFSCTLSLKHPAELNYVDLFFGTYQKVCRGNVNIKLLIDGKTTSMAFSINAAEVIEDNIPVRLLFNENQEKNLKAQEKVELVISATYERENTLAIWLNNSGVCAVLNGMVDYDFSFGYAPKISVITPVYRPELSFFKETVESVCSQLYDRWELVLINDASEDPKLAKYLREIKQNKRIMLVNKKENVGIAKATNAGIEKATGDFVGFLDHDDILTDDALLRMVQYLNEHPETDMVYSDEDKISEDGMLFGPFYKSDWNYNMLLSHMYTCHLSMYRRSILKELGGLRLGYDGSQDYDLALRFIEKTSHIGHVAEVLYHWRACEGSTARGIQNKPKARINAVRAIEDHLRRQRIKARVYAGPFQGHYHVDYSLDNFRKRPVVSIIIPFKDEVHYLENLLHTMQLTEYEPFEVILVNNRSVKKETRAFLKKAPEMYPRYHIKVYDYKKAFNFSAINNYIVGLGLCEGDLVLFLNSDIEIMHPEWLTELVKQFSNKNTKIVGGKLLYLNHQIQHAGIFVGVNGVAGVCHKKMYDHLSGYFSRPHIVQEVSAVTGACMMVNKSDFLRINGFDESLPKAFNDIDLCLRMRDIKDTRIIYTPYCRLYHLESMTRGLDDMKDPAFQAAIRTMEKRYDIFKYRDPYYNPNLPPNCEGARWI